MEYQYKAIKPNPEGIENALGLKGGDVRSWEYPIGVIHFDIRCDIDPETKKEIPPSIEQLAILNKMFANYLRIYTEESPFQEGEIRDLEKEVDQLKAKVVILEKVRL